MKVHETSLLLQVHLGKLRRGPSQGLRGAGPLVIFSALLGSSRESIHRAQAAPGGCPAILNSLCWVWLGAVSLEAFTVILLPWVQDRGQWLDKNPHPEHGPGW